MGDFHLVCFVIRQLRHLWSILSGKASKSKRQQATAAATGLADALQLSRKNRLKLPVMPDNKTDQVEMHQMGLSLWKSIFLDYKGYYKEGNNTEQRVHVGIKG